MRVIYNLFILLLTFGIKFFSLFNAKAKKGVEGRKKSLAIVKQRLSPSDQVIWMHAASLGEYEQGLPVLEQLKSQFPDFKILVTFFSPSGLENVINKKHFADVICYLPFDNKREIKDFVSCFNTQIFFTVKYDYWYNLLAEIKSRNAKVFVVSALFYENQVFFKAYGKWFVRQLNKNIDWFFHQTAKSSALAKSIGLKQSSVSGDTRFDRVKHFLHRDNYLPFIKEFKEDKRLVVFGSSWNAEEDIAKSLVCKIKNVKIIIAPHDLKRVSFLQDLFPKSLLYSALENESQLLNKNVLIIDSIGKLSKLYSYADLAVVGGGFHNAGLHNILEAAVYGVPVFFGNHYKKNPEADGLIDAGGAKSFDDFLTVSIFIKEMLEKENIDKQRFLKEMSEKAFNYVRIQPNSAKIITNKILTYKFN